MKKTLLALALLALALPIFAQNRTSFSGLRNAVDFAYGIQSNVAPLRVDQGNSTTGAGTIITLAFGNVTLTDGTVFMPFSTTAPITVGIGANAETVTPTAVNCGTPQVYSTCSVTATFANIHGIGDIVSSGTFGMAEAVNYTHSKGGGLVAFDAAWVALGGATSQFASKTYGWTNVTLLDYRGTINATTATTGFSWRATNATTPVSGGAYVVSAVALY